MDYKKQFFSLLNFNINTYYGFNNNLAEFISEIPELLKDKTEYDEQEIIIYQNGVLSTYSAIISHNLSYFQKIKEKFDIEDPSNLDKIIADLTQLDKNIGELNINKFKYSSKKEDTNDS